MGMRRNSTTIFLESKNATTPIPWVNDEPDFSAFTDPTLSVLQKAWADFLATGEELEVISDPVTSTLTLADAQAQKESEVRQYANNLRLVITKNASAAEAASWTNKELEAVKITDSRPALETPMLTAEAEARNISREDVASRVMANAVSWRVLEGRIAGVSGKHRDEIYKLTTVEAVLSYDWMTDWPSI